ATWPLNAGASSTHTHSVRIKARMLRIPLTRKSHRHREAMPGGLGTARPTLRFMESSVFLSYLLTAHEPKMRKSLQCRRASFRFMGSEHLQKSDVSCGHEPPKTADS